MCLKKAGKCQWTTNFPISVHLHEWKKILKQLRHIILRLVYATYTHITGSNIYREKAEECVSRNSKDKDTGPNQGIIFYLRISNIRNIDGESAGQNGGIKS